MKLPEMVWYAAYGSNILSERLHYYLCGGTLPNTKIKHTGARDKSPPRTDRALLLPHKLFFAQRSPRWGNCGVAFIDSRCDEKEATWARAWLLTREQFEDVYRQENRRKDVEIDWVALLSGGRYDGCNAWYGRLLALEADREGFPVLTFTTPDTQLSGATRPPHENYLGCIAAGLYECYHLGQKGMVNYLAALPGVKGAFTKGTLGRLWKEVVDHLNEDLGSEGVEDTLKHVPDELLIEKIDEEPEQT